MSGTWSSSYDLMRVWMTSKYGGVAGVRKLVVSFSFLFPSYLSSLCYIEDNASFKYGGSKLDSFI